MPSPTGATIPRSRTRPTNQIEDTMAALALFVNGGAVTTFQEIVDELNSVLPADAAQTRRISENLAANARDLASNQDDLDVLLDGLGGATQQVADKSPRSWRTFSLTVRWNSSWTRCRRSSARSGCSAASPRSVALCPGWPCAHRE